MTRRLIASLALIGLLVPCQASVGPPASGASGSAPASSPSGSPRATAGAWSRIPDMLTARSEVAAVVFEERIIVIGGIGGPKVVERYDPALKLWTRMPDLPIPLDHPIAAAIEEGQAAGIFVFGGYTTNGAVSKRSFYLERDGDAWVDLTALPEPRAAGAAVTIGRRIYILGGVSSNTLARSVLVFDLDKGPWLPPGKAIPTPRDHLAGAAIGGKACAIGGRELSASKNLGDVECYDPATDSWSKLPPLPTARGGIGAATWKDSVIVVGGEHPTGTFKEVEVLDTKALKWSRGPDLPTPRHGLAVAAVKGVVYAIAGGPTPGASQTKLGEVWTLP